MSPTHDESGPEPNAPRSTFLRSLVDEIVLQLLLVAAMFAGALAAVKLLAWLGDR